MGKNQGQKTSYQNQAYVAITGRKQTSIILWAFFHSEKRVYDF